MKLSLLLLLIVFASPLHAATWSMDNVADSLIVRGKVLPAAGAVGGCLTLDGKSLIELKDSARISSEAFSVSLWFNPYVLEGSQQMLAGKNRYQRGERQWSLTLEPNGKLKAYLRQDQWTTIDCDEPILAGKWHYVTLVADASHASLYLNGKPVGSVRLNQPIVATDAPITLGGIWDAERVRQAFHGAIDECSIDARVLSEQEIAAAYHPVSATHPLPKPTVGEWPLWHPTLPMPKANELPSVSGAEFHVIKKARPDTDGCNWTLGVGLAWHQGKLYASYGFNQGNENTPTEEAHVRISNDGGKTWGAPHVLDAGRDNLGVSHGVFHSHQGKLWAFMGAFYDSRQRTHTRAYLLDESSGRWQPQGVVVDDGFWPMQEPKKLADNNWIMAGFRVSQGYDQAPNLPAVAISHGDDFTRWKLVVIPAAANLGNIWGESTLIVEEKRLLNIARYGQQPLALVSISTDHGQTWTPATTTNLPMATSKPYAGTLSTGQHYLVCTTTADTGGKRSPLTIAVSQPGESVFRQVFLIRPSVFDATPGVSDPRADFSYPYAVEHDGKLYVGYTHKSHAANELAVLPIASLSVTADGTPSPKP